MGMFDLWKISGITTNAAKISYRYYLLADAVETNETTEIDLTELLNTAQAFVDQKEMFDQYFDGGVKKYKNDAVTFLVFLASYLMRKDDHEWNWQTVRRLSQGLYESMAESPAHFLHYNTPLINDIVTEIKNLIWHNR